jgi:hypothetical protein
VAASALGWRLQLRLTSASSSAEENAFYRLVPASFDDYSKCNQWLKLKRGVSWYSRVISEKTNTCGVIQNCEERKQA